MSSDNVIDFKEHHDKFSAAQAAKFVMVGEETMNKIFDMIAKEALDFGKGGIYANADKTSFIINKEKFFKLCKRVGIVPNFVERFPNEPDGTA